MQSNRTLRLVAAGRDNLVEDRRFRLMYTFTRVGDASAKNLNVTARAYLLRQLCADADTRQMMRDGLTFTFTYVDEAKAPTTGAVIGDGDCATPAR